MATTEEIIKQASLSNKQLRIYGYTTSEGRVLDLHVQLIGLEGYRQKVAQALEFIRKFAPKTSADVDAARELEESWNKTLAGQHAPRTFGDDLIPEGAYFKSAMEPTKVILKHLHKISEMVLHEPPPAPPNSRTRGSSEKTLAKKRITDLTPLGSYLGQLNLAPGKFKSLETVNA